MPEVDPEYAVVNESRDSSVAKHVRLAATSGTRRKGLLGLSTLSEDAGLWIVPCEAIHTFGMKMPIDTVFLDRAGRVRKIRGGLGSNRIAVCFAAHSVLELASGTVERAGIQVGDQLKFTAAV